MANVNTTVDRITPATAVPSSGIKLGFLDSATKAAQNDTVTITNASEIVWAGLTIDADGTEESVTISSNVLTLTDTTTGAVSGLVLYK
jgi:hypothetical protein